MTGYVANIEQLTKGNTFFREVLFTGERMQLVVMSLKPGEEIGLETHDSVDQFFRVDSGSGEVIMNGERSIISDGFAIIVPAGVEHNVVNTGSEDLKLYTVYAPPNHPDGTVHKTVDEAQKYEREHH